MKSRFPCSPSPWLGRHVQGLLSEFQNRCVAPSAMQPLQRRLSVAAEVAPVHRVRSIFHQPAQYPRIGRDSGSYAMLQRSFQCFGLTSNESARSMIPLDWLSPTGGLSGTIWLPSWRACPISLPNASIAGSLSHLSVTLLCPSLINEPRHSPCDPRELSSLSRNQHCPRHLVSPFTDDQHRGHLLFRVSLSKKPVLH